MCYSALPITCYSAAAQYTLIPPPLTPSHTNNIEKRLAERLNMYTCKSTSYLKNFADYHATIMYISYTSALPQFKVLSPAYVIAKRRWRANSARTGTLVWIGSNKSNPLLLLEIKQHDVIVWVDGSTKGLPPSIDLENFSPTLEPLLMGLHAVCIGRASRASCLPTVSSCAAKPFSSLSRVVDCNNFTGPDLSWPIVSVDAEDFSPTVVPLTPFHVQARARCLSTRVPSTAQEMPLAIQQLESNIAPMEDSSCNKKGNKIISRASADIKVNVDQHNKATNLMKWGVSF